MKKQGECYSVEVRAEANFLLRVDKILKATVQPACNCGGNRPPVFQARDGWSKGETGLEIAEITVLQHERLQYNAQGEAILLGNWGSHECYANFYWFSQRVIEEHGERLFVELEAIS